MESKEYTVTQYAELKGLTRAGVQKQIVNEKIKARKVGSVWIITTEDKTTKQ